MSNPPKQSKNADLLVDFIRFCGKHPEMRFWQALRNWSGFHSVFVGQVEVEDLSKVQLLGLEDTFYFNDKTR